MMPFLGAVPSIYAVVIGMYVVPRDQPHPLDKRIDWTGAGIITVAQLCLMLSLNLSVSQAKKWSAPCESGSSHAPRLRVQLSIDVPCLLAIAVLAFILFVWRQLFLDRRESTGKYPPPLTPRRLFAGSTGQLVPIYISAIFIFIQVDVSVAGISAY